LIKKKILKSDKLLLFILIAPLLIHHELQGICNFWHKKIQFDPWIFRLFYIFGLYSFRCLHFDSKLYFLDISVPLSLKTSEKVVKKIKGEKKLSIGHKKIKIGVNGFIFEKRI
jgi:hypothetical protein